MTDEPDRVLRRGGAEHRRRVDDLLDRPVEHPQLLRQRAACAPARPAPARAATAGRGTSSTTSDASPHDRPAARARSSSADPTPRTPSPARPTRPSGTATASPWPAATAGSTAAHPLRVTRREVLIAHDPIPVLGQQREKRPLRQRPSKLGRIEKPDLARHRREHPRMRLKPTGQHRRLFQEPSSRTSLGSWRQSALTGRGGRRSSRPARFGGRAGLGRGCQAAAV